MLTEVVLNNKMRSKIRRKFRKSLFSLFLGKHNHDMYRLMWFLV